MGEFKMVAGTDGRFPGGKPRWMETFLHVRQSFARFSDQPVPEECVRHVLELARLSPTEWYFQPWRWIVVQSEAGKRKLADATRANAPLDAAPLVLVCLADTSAWKTAPDRLREMVAGKKITEEQAREVLRRIREYYSVSPRQAERAALAHAFVALHQILIAATDCNLSAYWVSAFDEERIKTEFNIPDPFIVAALLAIGYGEEPLAADPQPAVQSLVYREQFGEAYSEE
jgi:nitroreductase